MTPAAILVNSALVGDQSVMPLSALTNSATVSTDGQLTPVSTPAPGVTSWADLRDGISKGFPRFSFSFREPTNGSPMYRGLAKWHQPILESNLGPGVNGVVPGPTEAYRNSASFSFDLNARSTAADRRVFLSYIISCLVKELHAADLSPVSVTGSPIPTAFLTLEGIY